MAEDYIYNPSTDNLERNGTSTEPMINPATGISNVGSGELERARQRRIMKQNPNLRKFVQRQRQKYPGETGAKMAEQFIQQSGITPQESISPRQVRLKSPAQTRLKRVSLGRRLGLVKRKSRPMADKMKVLRLQAMLDKKRLNNQIERLKLMRKMEQLTKKGILKPTFSIPQIKPKVPLYPAYATPETMGDIDSAFSADIGHGDKSLWGDENYYDETFYNEDFYGNEFDNDPFFHLQIKPNRNISPLLW